MDNSEFIDKQISQSIESCQNLNTLKQFACACAEYALHKTKVNDTIIFETLTKLREGKPLDKKQGYIQKIMNLLDDQAFAKQEQGEEEAYLNLFYQARAVNSLFNCFLENKQEAAIQACYEAYHATGAKDWVPFISLSQTYFT